MQLTNAEIKECARHLAAAEVSLKRAHQLAVKEGGLHSGDFFDLAVAVGAQLFVWERAHGSRARRAAGPALGEAEA